MVKYEEKTHTKLGVSNVFSIIFAECCNITVKRREIFTRFAVKQTERISFSGHSPKRTKHVTVTPIPHH